MTFRIAVSSTIDDARAHGYLRHLKSVFTQSRLEAVSFVQIYTIDANLTDSDVTEAAARLTNPISEVSSVGEIKAPQNFSHSIEIGFLPGVTDNVGHTARQTIEDCTGKKFSEGEAVYTSFVLFLHGDISEEDAAAFARELHNPLIERARVFSAGEEIPVSVPKVELHENPDQVTEVDLSGTDEDLMRISREGIQGRGPLALSLAAMKTIRDHFKSLGRNPTDVELESLAQTWSEHCKHTIFADPLDDISEGIYRRYIKGATQKIRQEKGDKDFCVSVFKDNSGAIAFDDTYLVTHKVETHNSPSGLDPFGGSVTAIVGVNRDALGFGLGAKPIANTYGFCVADPADARELYRDAARKQPLLPARRILEGVVKGVNAGGNQSGIPTPLGFVATDPSFRGKPLVFGGTVGLIPREKGGAVLYEKKANPGDYIVMLGGRVGLDGIHGATFSSESLSAGSPATAVQIGDPITQKKLSDAIVREARDQRLYSSITDDGAGGLSGSVGEMSREAGGCEVDLEKVPLKYPGLSPWQIWLSESQERMTLAVPPEKWDALNTIFDRHDVEATIIGTFTDSGSIVVRHLGKVVMNLSLDFLHDGRPVEEQKSQKPEVRNQPSETKNQDLAQTILEILARPSVGSTAFIAEQYDHEVQGSSVTKPLQGKGRVSADSGVLQPLSDSPKGIVLSHGYAPWYSAIDTYAMASAAIDTAIRNAIATGARREQLAILDNFCWSSSQDPQRLYELKEAARACYDVAVAYGTPFISGKDSMFNDFRGFNEQGEKIHIAALPTLLVSTLGVVEDVSKAVTLDLKRVGDLVYLLGETDDELGATEYSPGGEVPRVDTAKNMKVYDALEKAIEENYVASALGVGRGGLAIALAKSSVAGSLGADIDITAIHGKAESSDAKLFSESQGRILVSVRREVQAAFETLFQGLAFTNLGEVVQAAEVSIKLPTEKLALSLQSLTDAYRSYFKNW